MRHRGDVVARPSRSAGGGFSLIELLIGVVIVGLLLLAAGPSYRNWIAAQELANHRLRVRGLGSRSAIRQERTNPRHIFGLMGPGLVRIEVGEIGL